MLNKRLIRHCVGTMLLITALAIPGIAGTAYAQEESVRPRINDPFTNPDVEEWLARFEGENREIYTRRDEIVAVLNLKPGMDVADIGAGTGFFTILFAQKATPGGTVYALDIAENFITHIDETAEELGLANVRGIVNPVDSTTLAPDSVDVVFLAHTYHHFEYPFRMLESIRTALRPDGIVVLIGMERIEGVSAKFVLNMVRAGKGTFTDEFADAGFELIEEVPFSKENYILKFRQRQ